MTAGSTLKLNPSDIQLSSSAQQQFSNLIAEADQSMAGIRIFVSGGGCGGMTYGMTYAEDLTPYDAVLEGEGFRIVVDSVALNYLQGCTIDHVDQGLNSSFVFNNVFQSVGGSGTCGGCGGAKK